MVLILKKSNSPLIKNFQLKKIAEKQITRYLIVGGAAYLVEMLSLVGLVKLGFGSVTSVAVSFWIGLIAAFIFQKSFAFKDSRRDVSILAKQTLTYLALVMFNYGFTLVFISQTSDTLSVVWSRTLAIIITTTWNFLIYKKLFSAS